MAWPNLISVGAAANDGTGDPLRGAFQKINLKLSDMPCVSADFGAVGDSNLAGAGTNNTVAFNNALATGYSCRVPFGNFSVDLDALVVGNFQQRLIGTGRYTSQIICPSASPGTIVKLKNSWSSIAHLGIMFGTGVARQPGQKTLAIESADQGYIFDVLLQNGLVNLDIDSVIDFGVYETEAKNGELACRIAASKATYNYACNKLNFSRFWGTGHTGQMLRVDQSGTQNIGGLSFISSRSEWNGTSGSGLFDMDFSGIEYNGSQYGVYIEGFHAEHLVTRFIRMRGGSANYARTFTMVDSTIIPEGTPTLASLLDIDQCKVRIQGVNALGPGATNSVILGATTAGECLEEANIFAAPISKNDASYVRTRPMESKTVAQLIGAYTAANAASGFGEGHQVYVNNEAGGAVVAFTDGTNWRRLTDRAVVS